MSHYYLLETEDGLTIKPITGDYWPTEFIVTRGTMKEVLEAWDKHNSEPSEPSDEEYNSALTEFEGYTSEMAKDMWKRGYNDGTNLGFQSLAIGYEANNAELALYNIYQKGWQKGREDKATENLRELMETLV